jgi:uncharacterized membrane protein YraQ (UPF0718 family)
VYDVVVKIIEESWLVLGEMAPYLLLGFLVAGVLAVCIPPKWVERHLGKRGLGPVLTASLFGVPLPLCSCGVIPVSASIRRHGASRAATTAFLISTPQTGVDSIAVTYALLGPVFAVFRPLVALVTGILGGALVQVLDQEADEDGGNGKDDPGESGVADGPPRGSGTGSNNCEDACQATPPNGCTDSCCDSGGHASVVIRALRYGFVTLPRDIGPAMAVGILIAGAIAAVVPHDALRAYVDGGVVSILLMMVAAIPVYVCATASVPIALGLIHAGVSPGAALAFLIAGPATNAATLTSAWKFLGRRATVLYLATVAASALGSGLILDWLIPAVRASVPQLGAQPGTHLEGSWLFNAGAIAMLAVLAFSYASSFWGKSE